MAEQGGGYDYEFVETFSNNLMCKICHFASKDPQLIISVCCSHTFCKSYLEAAKRSTLVSVASVCPMCRNEDFIAYPNKQADRDIRSLHVYCPKNDKGCEWHGEVNAVDSHLDDRGLSVSRGQLPQ